MSLACWGGRTEGGQGSLVATAGYSIGLHSWGCPKFRNHHQSGRLKIVNVSPGTCSSGTSPSFLSAFLPFPLKLLFLTHFYFSGSHSTLAPACPFFLWISCVMGLSSWLSVHLRQAKPLSVRILPMHMALSVFGLEQILHNMFSSGNCYILLSPIFMSILMLNQQFCWVKLLYKFT